MPQFGTNPWLKQQGDALTASSNQNLQQNILPGIGQGAQQAGMYGSSRQGAAEGIAAGNAQTGLNSALANMYSTAYGQDQNYDLQSQQNANQMSIANMNNQTAMAGLKQSGELANRGFDLQGSNQQNQYNLGLGQLGLGNRTADQNYNLGQGNLAVAGRNADNNYNLGLGQLANTNQGQMQNFYTSNRQLDQSGTRLGADLFGVGNQGNLGIGQGQYNLGQTNQNAPINALGQYQSFITPYTGLGGSSTTTGSNNSGGGAQGFLGGALGGAQIFNNLGFGGGAMNEGNRTGRLPGTF